MTYKQKMYTTEFNLTLTKIFLSWLIPAMKRTQPLETQSSKQLRNSQQLN